MEANEVISKWRGDMQGDMECVLPIAKDCPNVPSKEVCPSECGYHVIPHPDYEHSPAAWTPELFDRIEGAGLWRPFIQYLGAITQSGTEWKKSFKENVDWAGWLIAKATPAQKAEALSRAIQEVE